MKYIEIKYNYNKKIDNNYQLFIENYTEFNLNLETIKNFKYLDENKKNKLIAINLLINNNKTISFGFVYIICIVIFLYKSELSYFFNKRLDLT